MAWKVYVKAYGEKSYNSNGLGFETQSEAESYGNELLSRWLGAETFYTTNVENAPVNYRFNPVTNKAESIA